MVGEKLNVKYGENKGFDVYISIFESANPGPTVVLTAGIHGDEHNGVEVIKNIQHFLKNNNLLKGKVVLFHSLNPQAIEANVRYFPETNEDLNRAFTDNPVTEGQKIASQIKDKILGYKPEVVFDIHNDWEDSIPYTLLEDPKNISDAVLLNFPMITETEDVPGALTGYLHKKGIHALTLEIGGQKVNKANIKSGARALLHYLAKRKMVKFSLRNWYGKFSAPRKIAKKVLSYESITTPIKKEEIEKVNYKAKAGKFVKKGQVVAEVITNDKQKIKIISQASGIVLSHNEKIPVYPEDSLYALGTTA